VSEDDGLAFQLAQTIDGEEEICANFRGQDFEGADGLRRLLAQDKLWDVFRLRAIVILQQRVFEQLQALFETQESVELTPHGDGTPIRTGPWDLALKLRRLEFELLEKAYEVFEAQVSKTTVYLARFLLDAAHGLWLTRSTNRKLSWLTRPWFENI
jgi:hypothetical protein